MANLEARISSVDGGGWEIPLQQHDLDKLYRLQKAGYSGKALIHEWLTDDWEPPPVYIDVVGTGADGRKVNIRLMYD
jgi:hypothetical protein